MMGGNNMLSTSYFAVNKININLAETDAYTDYAAEGTRNDAHSIIVGCKAGHVGYGSAGNNDDESEVAGENEYCIKAGANKSVFLISSSMFTGTIYAKDRVGRLVFSDCAIKKDSEIISDNSTIIFFNTMFQNNNPNMSVTLLNNGQVLRRSCLTYSLVDPLDFPSDGIIWVQGGISAATGKRRKETQTLYDTRISSREYIQVNKGNIIFTIPEGWKGALFYYDTPDESGYLSSTQIYEAGAMEIENIPGDYLLVMMFKDDEKEKVNFCDFTAKGTIVVQ